MAGVRGELTFDEALGVASFLVQMGRVPHPSAWVDDLIIKAQDALNETFVENFF